MLVHEKRNIQPDTLVFIHGFPLDHSMWEDQLTAFSGSYRAVAPDLRGFGESKAVSEVSTMDEMADDIVLWLDEQKIDSCFVCGFSMGGYVAFSLLNRYPERIKGLVLCDTKAEADTAEGKAGRKKLAEAVLKRGAGAASEAMLGKLLSKGAAEHRPSLISHVEEIMLRQPPEGIAAAALGMAERADRSGELSAIGAPTLVIVGSDDVITPPDGARKMADAIPDAAFEIIEGAGHLANMEQPEAFNRVLLDWLKRFHNIEKNS